MTKHFTSADFEAWGRKGGKAGKGAKKKRAVDYVKLGEIGGKARWAGRIASNHIKEGKTK